MAVLFIDNILLSHGCNFWGAAVCPPCMRGVCCTVSCNGSEKTAAPFTNGLQVFHLPFRFGVYTAYISRRESRFPAPPLIREKKPFFQIHPYGPLPAREESQTGRPTIPPRASGVLIDLFIHDLSKARRGAGFPNRRPVLPRFAREKPVEKCQNSQRETRAASSADSRPWVSLPSRQGARGRSVPSRRAAV